MKKKALKSNKVILEPLDECVTSKLSSDKVFKWGKDNLSRFPKARDKLYHDILHNFGPSATFIKTGKKYEESTPEFPDLSKEADERKKDELVYTYRENMKIVQRKNKQYSDDLYKIYPMIIERLSPESLAKVEKAHPEFDSMIRDKLDAVELWKLFFF